MRNFVVCLILFGGLGAIGLRLQNPESFDQYANSALDFAGDLRASRPLPPLESLPVSKALRPAQAYRAIPHRRTEFNFQDAKLSQDDSEYLKRIFPLLDQCVVWRVTGLQRLQRRKPNTQTLAEADALLEFVESFDAPRAFRRYHKQLVTALSAQRAYFETASELAKHDRVKSDPHIQRASRALHTAYSEMLRQVGESSPKNKNAVFDYHCAFDFI